MPVFFLRLTTLMLVVGVAPVASGQTGNPTPTNRFLIRLAGAASPNLADVVAAAGGRLLRVHEEIGYAYATSDDPDFASRLQGTRRVSQVDQDYEVQWVPGTTSFAAADGPIGTGHVGDPTMAFFYPCQWNLHQIGAAGAWAHGYFGDPDVKVAVLDTGTDPFHSDLAGQIDLAQSMSMLSAPTICDAIVDDVGTFYDFNAHGAFVSGLVAAKGLAISGVAPHSTIVAVKVLNCQLLGTAGDVIAGILYAASLPDVDVISMSLAARFPKNLPGAGSLVAALNKAVNYAQGVKGKLVVSAAGNEGADLDHDGNFITVPAQSGSGIAAWAGDIDGNLASYSNHGVSGAPVGAGGGDDTPGSPNVPLPGCVLPLFGHDGIVSVCSTLSLFFPCDPLTYLFNGAGTSFSAPLVSGVGALVDGKHGGSKNGGQLKTILANTADDLGKKGADNMFGRGRVNATKAVKK